MADRLYLIDGPWTDGRGGGFCTDCATVEGGLLANPEWASRTEIRRLSFARPRQELADLLGEDCQDMPVLIMPPATAPENARRVGEWAILHDPVDILRALHHRHGGYGPRP
jgi:hypothetical protein